MAHIKIPKHVQKLLKTKKGTVIKLDIGCGDAKEKGFIGIDCRKLPGVDIVTDVEASPLPLPDVCATLVMARNIIEYIEPRKFLAFMDECWRVLKIDGQMLILTPYAGCTAFWTDPLIVNGCTARTWDFLDPDREAYKRYAPKPWKVENCFFRTEGSMEVLLIKRKDTKK